MERGIGSASDLAPYRAVSGGEPWSFYSQLAERSPVWDDSMDAWLVADYATCAKILQQERIFERADDAQPGATSVRGDGRNLAVLHGRAQTKLHRYYLSFMDESRSAEYLTTVVQPTVDRLIDQFESSSRVELASMFCDLLPVRVGIQLLGLDPNDEELAETIRHVNADFSRYGESWGEDLDVTQTAAASVRALKRDLLPLIRSRRDHPGDDHISRVWATGGTIYEDWNEDDTFSASWLLLRGGETVFALRNMVYLLVSEAGVQQRLRSNRSLVPQFVDETLRYVGVLHWPVRRATRDVDFGAVRIKAGQNVIPLLSAAGRDSRRYDEAQCFDPSRESKQHLAFGFGPRYCPGRALARTELMAAADALLSRFDSIRLDPTAEQPHYAAFRLRSYYPLNVVVGRRNRELEE